MGSGRGKGGRVECSDLGYYECFSLAKPGARWNVGRQEGLRTVTDVLRGGQGRALTGRSERGAVWSVAWWEMRVEGERTSSSLT